MVIAHNLSAQNAQRHFGINNGKIKCSIEKLSSGYRINRAADDAAGLAISEKMRTQIRGLNRASKNALDGISVLQTAEGAYGEMQAMLHRINELCTQAANDTNTATDRRQIQQEIDQLIYEIDDGITQTTTFNTKKILMGTNYRNDSGDVDKTLKGEDALLTYWETRKGHLDSAGGTGTPMKTFEDDGILSIEGMGFEPASIPVFMDLNGALTGNEPGYSAFFNTAYSDVATIDVQGTNSNGNIIDNMYFFARGGTTMSPWPIGNAGPMSFEETNAFLEKYVNPFNDARVRFFNSMDSLITAVRADFGEDLKKFNYSQKTDGTYDIKMQAWADQNEPLELKLQVGALEGQGITISMEHLNARGLGINGLSVDNFEDAGKAMKKVQKAIDKISTARANLGAQQNRLEHTINNLDNIAENTQASESRIRDMEMAQAMVEFTKNQILQQASQSFISNANRVAESVLTLLS